MSEAWRMPKESRRVLQAAAMEAYGRPGMYVLREPVMQRVNIFDVAEFLTIAQYLSKRVDSRGRRRLRSLRPHPRRHRRSYELTHFVCAKTSPGG